MKEINTPIFSSLSAKTKITKWIFLLLGLGVLGCGIPTARNSSTKKSVFLDDTDKVIFQKNYSRYIQPQFSAYPISFIKSSKDTRMTLAYQELVNSDKKKALIIFPGAGENSLKYRELAYNFFQENYCIYIFEYRDHGYSTRLLADNPEPRHIDDFSSYLNDVQDLLREVVYPKHHDKLYLYAHSMGGAIALRFLELYPNIFSGAILDAPMVKINTGKYPEPIAKIISSGLTKISGGEGKITQVLEKYGLTGSDYAFGEHGVLEETPDPASALTHSEARFLHYQDEARKLEQEIVLNKTAVIQDNRCLHIPHNQSCHYLLKGGSTFSWVAAALSFSQELRKPKEYKKISTPIFMAAAEKDTLVINDSLEKFCKSLSQCEWYLAKGAKHQIFFETNEMRTPYLTRAIHFLSDFD